MVHVASRAVGSSSSAAQQAVGPPPPPPPPPPPSVGREEQQHGSSSSSSSSSREPGRRPPAAASVRLRCYAATPLPSHTLALLGDGGRPARRRAHVQGLRWRGRYRQRRGAYFSPGGMLASRLPRRSPRLRPAQLACSCLHSSRHSNGERAGQRHAYELALGCEPKIQFAHVVIIRRRLIFGVAVDVVLLGNHPRRCRRCFQEVW